MSKRTLLLADDSITIQKVVNLTFADEGIEVISVSDGDTAMEKIAEISPDLIMADVNMPGLTGYEICEHIRADELLRQTPVILLVGSFEPFDEQEARRVGADDYLTKPFQSIRQLVNKVTTLLDNSKRDNNIGSFEDTVENDSSNLKKSFSDTSFTEKDYDKDYDDELVETTSVSSFNSFQTNQIDYTQSAYQAESQQIEDYNDFEEEKISLNSISSQYSDNTSTEAANSEEKVEFEDNSNLSFSDNQTEESVYRPGAYSDVERFYYTDKSETEKSDDNRDEESLNSDSYSSGYSKAEDLQENETESTPVQEESGEYYQNHLDSPTVDQSVKPESTDIETDFQDNSQQQNYSATDNSSTQTQPEDEMPLPETASVLEFDDDDILQLPPLEFDFEEEVEEEKSVVETTQNVEGNNPTEVENTSETVDSTGLISSQMIDEIVNKVVAKLSDKAVKEIAWEVVPQMTELIVKKMAEEKLKD